MGIRICILRSQQPGRYGDARLPPLTSVDDLDDGHHGRRCSEVDVLEYYISTEDDGYKVTGRRSFKQLSSLILAKRQTSN